MLFLGIPWKMEMLRQGRLDFLSEGGNFSIEVVFNIFSMFRCSNMCPWRKGSVKREVFSMRNGWNSWVVMDDEPWLKFLLIKMSGISDWCDVFLRNRMWHLCGSYWVPWMANLTTFLFFAFNNFKFQAM